ncbi:MAG: DUF421 domain-containing protein [Thermosyntropha sp.]|nr:DUF421 domain-containing protein [Thermosyntropha sp.]
MHPLDFITAIVLGELVGAAVYEPKVNIFYIIYALFFWALLHLAASYLTLKLNAVRYYIDDTPSIVIRNGKIDKETLRKNKMDINQLQNLLRQKGVFSIKEVAYAILERDGSCSIMKKPEYDTPTLADLGLPVKTAELPVTVILDGEIIKDNLELTGFNEKWLKKELEKRGVRDIKEVLLAEWQQSSGLYVVLQ